SQAAATESETERGVNPVSGLAEADALIRRTAAAKHREVRRSARGGDHVLRVTLGVAHVHLDVVAWAGRQILDLQCVHHRTAPLFGWVTGDFRQVVRHTARAQDVVGRIHFVRRGRNLEQTPGLVDADVADNVRSVRAAVGERARSGESTGNAEVQKRGTV